MLITDCYLIQYNPVLGINRIILVVAITISNTKLSLEIKSKSILLHYF